ncbi:hypothetical protein KSD_11730 [Ktedonobacter sp. SOSP1-85]|nr:hypothetical protein KSD_11730 [Ktedonobacter sp. SOSP1-85]
MISAAFLFCACGVERSHKPNSVPAQPLDYTGGNHLSGTLITQHLKQPTRGLTDEPPASLLDVRGNYPLCSVLLRMGFAQPADHPAAGELLPHHFALTCALTYALSTGGMFLLHFP